MKSIILKHQVKIIFLFDALIIFLSILQIRNNKLELEMLVLGCPLGYINGKFISNKTFDKKSRLLIFVSFLLTVISFLYTFFI
ncbi:hypothetical protein KTC96_22555 (plasmid) [Clostridium estertheticum]|uniref:Uncharacterized protein n=1 Tax=Clostridium estertheticum TaxID=238834 RepID=A0A5N7IV66_9CLOT|nr:hypothetical protein [Clostridium estertheticum]MBX4260421.1 hypothetical protein [Clostridium estertheticum]MPQ34181.1 hypothetical protein [Clostridium estertheticum]MPQ64604.1 hypothetical protein [Clostridium estertheticum]WLC72999.1 hypothetical protein KTC96_22555 [Clostridium estertheticum]